MLFRSIGIEDDDLMEYTYLVRRPTMVEMEMATKLAESSKINASKKLFENCLIAGDSIDIMSAVVLSNVLQEFAKVLEVSKRSIKKL